MIPFFKGARRRKRRRTAPKSGRLSLQPKPLPNKKTVERALAGTPIVGMAGTEANDFDLVDVGFGEHFFLAVKWLDFNH